MAKKITIYKGNIHKLYPADISLHKDTVVPVVAEEVITDNGWFTYSMHQFINLDYGTTLASEDEALSFMTERLEGSKGTIYEVLNNPDATEEEKKQLLAALKKYSSCLFYVQDEMKPSHTVSRKELRKIKKERLRQPDFK